MHLACLYVMLPSTMTGVVLPRRNQVELGRAISPMFDAAVVAGRADAGQGSARVAAALLLCRTLNFSLFICCCFHRSEIETTGCCLRAGGGSGGSGTGEVNERASSLRARVV